MMFSIKMNGLSICVSDLPTLPLPKSVGYKKIYKKSGDLAKSLKISADGKWNYDD